MVTEGDVATWFCDAVQSALERLDDDVQIGECYAFSQLASYPPDRFHALPANRRYGVWVHATCGSKAYRFFWDSLEQAVSSFDPSGTEQIIRCSHFRSMPEFRDRITSAVDAIVHDTCGG